MQSIKKILAPTDLSELSQVGVRYALDIAHSEGAEVIIYHVIGQEETSIPYEGFYTESLAKLLPQERKKLLSEFLTENFREMIPRVQIRQEVDTGVPYKRILEKALEEGVDMIVMSTHGRTGLLHMVIGSVTERVVRRATCPVFSIRPAKETRATEALAG